MLLRLDPVFSTLTRETRSVLRYTNSSNGTKDRALQISDTKCMPTRDRRFVGPFPCEVDLNSHHNLVPSNPFSTSSNLLCYKIDTPSSVILAV